MPDLRALQNCDISQMNDLNKKAFSGLFRLIIIVSLMNFLPAWTLDYWQAWIFLGLFFLCVLAITVYLMKKDPKLLERRIKAGSAAENRKSQKVIQFLASISFVSIFILSSIDHRLAWSQVPVYLVLGGDIFVVLGLLFVFFVFRENSFASATIEIGAQQTLVSTGPYSLIRHPMYLGAFVMLLGLPAALGSAWGLLAVIPIMLVIVWRLIDEERFLIKNLPGYGAYQEKVKYRLLPFVW